VFARVLSRQRGFSLLELLVALIVVVLFTSLANLTVNSGGEDIQLQGTVYNLADVAAYALDEAQIVFYASGEATVGAINVLQEEDSELLWRIEWDLFGRFEVLRRGVAEEEY
jgi:prepilin-type N-terminal cleavage/methylation domain-containing protein